MNIRSASRRAADTTVPWNNLETPENSGVFILRQIFKNGKFYSIKYFDINLCQSCQIAMKKE